MNFLVNDESQLSHLYFFTFAGSPFSAFFVEGTGQLCFISSDVGEAVVVVLISSSSLITTIEDSSPLALLPFVLSEQ